MDHEGPEQAIPGLNGHALVQGQLHPPPGTRPALSSSSSITTTDAILTTSTSGVVVVPGGGVVVEVLDVDGEEHVRVLGRGGPAVRHAGPVAEQADDERGGPQPLLRHGRRQVRG